MPNTVVLGAGIVGSAAVWDLVRRGHAVTVADADSGAAAQAADSYGATPVHLDVEDQPALDALLDDAAGLDLVVLNAGMLGEIRDSETMDYAIAFAETGHLCLATLHANNANQAMDRIINFFPEDRHTQVFMDLSMNMKAFLAQQLIPSADGTGRRVCVEILLGTPLVHDVIRKGEIHKLKDLMKQSTQQGMVTFDQALFKLYKEGEITYDDALHYADSANEVRLMIKLDSGDVDQYAAAMDSIQLVEED